MNLKPFKDSFPRAYFIVFWVISGLVLVLGVAALIGMVMGLIKAVGR